LAESNCRSSSASPRSGRAVRRRERDRPAAGCPVRGQRANFMLGMSLISDERAASCQTGSPRGKVEPGRANSQDTRAARLVTRIFSWNSSKNDSDGARRALSETSAEVATTIPAPGPRRPPCGVPVARAGRWLTMPGRVVSLKLEQSYHFSTEPPRPHARRVKSHRGLLSSFRLRPMGSPELAHSSVARGVPGGASASRKW
jgi:hypothetical protein